MKPPKQISIIFNRDKSGAAQLAESLGRIAAASGVSVRISGDYPITPGLLADADAACVIGGDGTILGVMPESLRSGTPVLGINLGKLGFLASVQADAAEEPFRRLLRGDVRILQRSILRARSGDGQVFHALNDVVIKTHSSGLMRLRVRAGEEWLTDYICDGLIFATPTGSTAYNLSAGGPIVHPHSEVFLLTPICPHTLSNRAVIVPSKMVLQANLCDRIDAVVTSIDGAQQLPGPDVFPLELSAAEERFQLIAQPEHSYYEVVRNKLGWGQETRSYGSPSTGQE